jgi:DNA-binding transcriptional LysR family regulator
VIRIGELADSSLIATPIATQTFVLCASPGYFARFSEPRRPAELLAHRLLDKIHGADLLGWAEVLGNAIEHDDARAVFRSDDFEALRLAALAGLGIANLPDWWWAQTYVTGTSCTSCLNWRPIPNDEPG